MTRIKIRKLVLFLENSLRVFDWDCEHYEAQDRYRVSSERRAILNRGSWGMKCLNFAINLKQLVVLSILYKSLMFLHTLPGALTSAITKDP